MTEHPTAEWTAHQVSEAFPWEAAPSRSLAMDCPEPRPVQGPEHGEVMEVEEASGLYRHYERRAA